jgi:hypothetical protein
MMTACRMPALPRPEDSTRVINSTLGADAR